MAYFTTPEEVSDYLHELLQVNGGDLGLQYIAYGDEEKLPRMPAARVVTGPLGRDIHGTRQFEHLFRVDVFVYHGNLRITHAQRSKSDLELCTRIRQLVHSDMTLGGGVIQGWFITEQPLLTTRGKAPAVVTTQMIWQGTALQVFSL